MHLLLRWSNVETHQPHTNQVYYCTGSQLERGQQLPSPRATGRADAVALTRYWAPRPVLRPQPRERHLH